MICAIDNIYKGYLYYIIYIACIYFNYDVLFLIDVIIFNLYNMIFFYYSLCDIYLFVFKMIELNNYYDYNYVMWL